MKGSQETHGAERPVHYVVWTSTPGGMESFVTAYAQHFKPLRKVHLFSARPSANLLSGAVDGFSQGSHSNLSLYRNFYSYCRRHRKDLFHLLNSGPVMLLLALLAGVRSPIYHIHGTVYWKGTLSKWAYRFVWRLTLPFKVVFIANSRYSAQLFRERAIPVQPRVVYNGIESAPFIASRRPRTALKRMCYAGRLAPGKNVHLVLQLYNALAASNDDIELHIAGTGSLEQKLMDKALGSPFRRRIFFHGWIGDMADFYSTMDLMVFPSAHESFGNVLVEGLMNGLPVLTSDVPVFEEIHGDKDMFCIGSPSDPHTFDDNFNRAIKTFDELAQKAYALSDKLAAAFSMEDHLRAIAKAYEER